MPFYVPRVVEKKALEARLITWKTRRIVTAMKYGGIFSELTFFMA